jgi:hypothetical protein
MKRRIGTLLEILVCLSLLISLNSPPSLAFNSLPSIKFSMLIISLNFNYFWDLLLFDDDNEAL